MINDQAEVVTDINVPFPEDQQLTLILAVGACRVRIVPGGDAWVSGTYTALEGVMPLKIEQTNGTLRISQEIGINTRMRTSPRFDLTLGSARSYRFKLETGASDCKLDVGGLPITEMLIREGASSMVMDFSAPNPEVMQHFILESGAGSFDFKNLSNANFKQMTVEGGAGSYNLDFGGELKRDALIDLKLGASSLDVIVPSTTPIEIKTDTVMGSVNARGFAKQGRLYANQATVNGGTPRVSIKAKVAMGSINLRES
jgi:hypothetical protein